MTLCPSFVRNSLADPAMMMVPIDPAARDFAIERFLDDLAAGRAERDEGESLRSELRLAGDVARLERVSREIAARG